MGKEKEENNFGYQFDLKEGAVDLIANSKEFGAGGSGHVYEDEIVKEASDFRQSKFDAPSI